MKRQLKLAIATLILGPSLWAFNPQTFRLSYSFESLTVENALHSKYSLIGEENPWMFGLSYSYQDDPLIRVNSSGSFLANLVEKYHSVNFIMAHHLELGEKKAVLGLRGNYANVAVNGNSSSSLGDTNVSLKVQLTETEDSAIAITPFIDIPTGDRTNFASDDSIGLGILASYEKHWDRFHLMTNLGFRHAKNAVFANVDLASRILTGVSGTYDLSDKLALLGEFRGEFGVPFDEDQNPIEVIGGVKYKVKPQVNTFVGIGAGSVDFSDTSTNAESGDFRFFAAVKWVPETRKQIIYKHTTSTIEKEKIRNLLHVLRNVNFHLDTADLTKKSKKILRFVAKVIRKHRNKIRLIYVQGHTDTTASNEYNKGLSQRRSASVVRFLSDEEGLPESLFVPQGFGEERPLVVEKSARDRAINRRVEFNIIYN